MAQQRVAIIGAGVGGSALAMLLKKHLPGCTPIIFEAADAIREVGAGISLAPNGLRVLDELGLAAKLVHDVGEPLRTMHVTRPDDTTIVSFDTGAEQAYGFPMLGLRRHRLIATLLDAAVARGIPLQLGKRLAAIHGLPPAAAAAAPAATPAAAPRAAGPVTLEFEDGSSYEANLVVGFDGLRSRTRAIIRGGAEEPPTYTQEEVVFAVTRDRNQDLVPPHVLLMVYGPPGKAGGHQHFGSYGLGPDCSWFTSVQRPQGPGRAGAGAGEQPAPDSWGLVRGRASVAAVLEELAARFEGWALPQRMFEREVDVMIRVGIFDRPPTASWVRGCVALAGDAGAPIPPNLGQGGNKALENAGVLAHCLARSQGDVQAALGQYQRISSRRAADLLDYSRQASAVANLSNPVAIVARNALLRTIVALNGTIPNGWMWQYDAAAVVAGDA